ncbi:MAG: efflux RND transporter periplasmic adaptor subunit [Gemmatimonadetes bacterium]|nr:efflux RND transporter periplasmic adaptor subunit [Gemmatimonadota bacterium]
MTDPTNPPSTMRRALGITLGVAVLGAAVFAAWFMTRSPESVPIAADPQDHSGMAGMAGTPGPDSTPAKSEGLNTVMLTDDGARRIGITYATVTQGSFAREIRTVGQVKYDETRVTTIAPKIDGWVEQLFVDFTGRAVQAGEPLLSVYAPMLVAAQEELLLATRLVADVKDGSPDARRGADELAASARRRLTYWDIPEADIARIERTGVVERTLTLRAGTQGVVVEKAVFQGQRIMPGDALFKIADLSVVWVEGEVFEQDLRAMRLGLSVTAEIDAFPGESWRGRISYIYPTVNADTRTARVRIELANPRLRLMPGMYATLRLNSEARQGVLTVPRSAVLTTGERSIVFVKRPDAMLEPHLVVLGAANDGRIEIIRGVKAGDVVVASGTFLVDSESNLNTLMGGMGSMPGMDMSAPVGAKPPQE